MYAQWAISDDSKIQENHGVETLGASVFSLVVPVGGARGVVVQALTQNVRYTLSNGQAPTAAIGFQLKASDSPVFIPLYGGVTPQFFREQAGAILQYQFVSFA